MATKAQKPRKAAKEEQPLRIFPPAGPNAPEIPDDICEMLGVPDGTQAFAVPLPLNGEWGQPTIAFIGVGKAGIAEMLRVLNNPIVVENPRVDVLIRLRENLNENTSSYLAYTYGQFAKTMLRLGLRTIKDREFYTRWLLTLDDVGEHEIDAAQVVGKPTMK